MDGDEAPTASQLEWLEQIWDAFLAASPALPGEGKEP